MTSQGIIYVAYGDRALSEAAMSIRALRLRHDHALPVATISERPIEGARHIPFADPRWGARWAKLNLDLLTPFDQTVYLDADTRPRAELTALFDMLADGFELVIAPSTMQGDKALWHVAAGEREDTLNAFGFSPVQLQAGVIAFRRCEAVAALFAAWREEWRGGQDQAALLRALYRCPVKLWLMSSAMSEALVAHVWGRLH